MSTQSPPVEYMQVWPLEWIVAWFKYDMEWQTYKLQYEPIPDPTLPSPTKEEK